MKDVYTLLKRNVHTNVLLPMRERFETWEMTNKTISNVKRFILITTILITTTNIRLLNKQERKLLKMLSSYENIQIKKNNKQKVKQLETRKEKEKKCQCRWADPISTLYESDFGLLKII